VTHEWWLACRQNLGTRNLSSPLFFFPKLFFFLSENCLSYQDVGQRNSRTDRQLSILWQLSGATPPSMYQVPHLQSWSRPWWGSLRVFIRKDRMRFGRTTFLSSHLAFYILAGYASRPIHRRETGLSQISLWQLNQSFPKPLSGALTSGLFFFSPHHCPAVPLTQVSRKLTLTCFRFPG